MAVILLPAVPLSCLSPPDEIGGHPAVGCAVSLSPVCSPPSPVAVASSDRPVLFRFEASP